MGLAILVTEVTSDVERQRSPRLTRNPNGVRGDERRPAGPRTASGTRKATRLQALGRYRLVCELGKGGMGTVHLARCDGPGGFRKWLAIKTCHATRDHESDVLPMFLDEARVAAQVSHPNVVSVFDAGSEDGVHYMAMEYLHGEPLREFVRHVEACGIPVPIHVACRVIADAAEGLHAAHEARNDQGEPLNIVHRDVSPHNLFVTYDGTTKLVDFGVAKFRAKASQTRVGTIKGKVSYMAPEQVRGLAVDRRADVFALGIILWELTTARRLFHGDDTLDTIARVLDSEIPRPTTLVRGYPADLEAVVMGALAKDPDERFGTAHDLARALTGVLFRRGLFVTGDDVFHYMQAVFHDRILERDAVLRTSAALSLRREPSSPAHLPPPARSQLPRPTPPPRGPLARASEAETVPLPLVHPSKRAPSDPTMSIHTQEIEGSIDVILDEEDLADAAPALVVAVQPAPVRPRDSREPREPRDVSVLAPKKGAATSVLVLALTVLALMMLGFAVALAMMLLVK